MNHDCPTCGQPLPEGEIRFHFDAGIVVGRGCFVTLPRREMQVLEYLWQHRGRMVTRAQIFDEIYAHDGDVEWNEVVESHMSKMRRKVRPLGIEIRAERFKGYQLLVREASVTGGAAADDTGGAAT